MSEKKRKTYSAKFIMETVRLITEKDYSIAEASRELVMEYGVLRRLQKQLIDTPENAFPGNGKRKADHERLRQLQRELERVKGERDILKKSAGLF